MVKNHEDAYRLKKLSLFTVECGHYWGQKNKKYGENWLLWFIPMSGEYCRIIFVLQGVPKNCQNWHFLEPLIATFIIQSLNYFFSYKGLQKWRFLQFFWTPCKTKIVLQYSPDMEITPRCQISPYFWFSEKFFSRYASSWFLTIRASISLMIICIILFWFMP